MFKLVSTKKLLSVAVVVLILACGVLFAQLSDLSGEDPFQDDGIGIGLPVTVVTEDAELTASDAAAGDRFGIAVAVSGDTAVVGAYTDEHSSIPFAGSAYVFVRGGTGWSEQAKLTASDAAFGDVFGRSVALSGSTLVVGASQDDDSGFFDAGSAYVFVRNGTAWIEQAKLTASDPANFDVFGESVAVSGDTAVVAAAVHDHAGGTNAGSVYVFVRDGTGWTEQAKLTASDAATEDRFGRSVAILGDTLLVGAIGDDHAGAGNAGSVYIFVRNGTSWSEQGKLIASDAASHDVFGISVALSGDTAVVGASGDFPGVGNAGSAYVFVRDGTVWSEQAKLTASDGAADDFFGNSVALSGNTAVVGAFHDEHSGIPLTGSAYVFVRNGPSWSEFAKLTASDAGNFDDFGLSAALAGDTAVVGAFFHDHGGSPDAGSAYVFGVPDGGDDDEDEDEDSDEFGDNLANEWLEDGQGQGMSDLMADDDLLEDDNHSTTHGRSPQERIRRDSVHALLTALSQGHSVEVRLRIVKELAGKVDVSLHALLRAHLERTRAEAQEDGKSDLADQTVQLLSNLETK